MAWIFNSLSLPRKKPTLVLPALSSRYPISHRRRAGVAQGMDTLVCWYLDGGILQLLLKPCWLVPFPWRPRCSLIWDFEWSPPKMYLGLWFEYQDKMSLCLAELKSCGCCTRESCLLRSVSQGMVCNCAMDKMGGTGKTGGKGLLWPFQPMVHLSACPRDAAEHSLWGKLLCIIVPVELGQKCLVAFSSHGCSSTRCSRTNLIQ